VSLAVQAKKHRARAVYTIIKKQEDNKDEVLHVHIDHLIPLALLLLLL